MDLLTAFDGLLLRVGLYLLIFWPTVGYYVAQDARKRGRSSPRLRGLAYGFFGVLGLVVYLARRERGERASDR
jgi:hypothetical protein